MRCPSARQSGAGVRTLWPASVSAGRRGDSGASPRRDRARVGMLELPQDEQRFFARLLPGPILSPLGEPPLSVAVALDSPEDHQTPRRQTLRIPRRQIMPPPVAAL